jgi:hypothetical protein
MAPSSEGNLAVKKSRLPMYATSIGKGVVMTDDATVQIVSERFERRLAEECGELRVDMATEFGKVRVDMTMEFGKVRTEMADGFGKVRTEMADGLGQLRSEMTQGFGALRSEMSDRNAELLKWGLVFGATQTAALAAVIAVLR